MALCLDSLGIPTTCELHHFVLSPALRRLIRRVRVQRSVSFVCISRALADLLVNAGCSGEAILVAHDGVDLERFDPPADRCAARLSVGFPTDQRIVCHCGHLYAGRGTETLMACAARMPDVRFVFIGGTAQDVARHREAAQRNSLSNVSFIGDVANTDVPTYLYAADVLAMPYTRETPTHRYMSPMKMFEYLAAGRPIVASDFPVLHEVLEHERNVLFVPPGDPAAFQSGLERALGDNNLAENLAAQGRRTAERYTWIERQRRVLSFMRERIGGLRTADACPVL
jgi:glycosyltransferase involved in cell wall biosynthesis